MSAVHPVLTVSSLSRRPHSGKKQYCAGFPTPRSSWLFKQYEQHFLYIHTRTQTHVSGDGRWPTFEPGPDQSELSPMFLVPVGSPPSQPRFLVWPPHGKNEKVTLCLYCFCAACRLPVESQKWIRTALNSWESFHFFTAITAPGRAPPLQRVV